MTESSWTWDLKTTEPEARAVLANPAESRFIYFAALLLARNNEPKIVFTRYLTKEHFVLYWQSIKRQMRKNRWLDNRIIFWESIYRYLVRDYKAKGIVLKLPKPKVKLNRANLRAGEEIKKARRMKGWNQKQLAGRLKVSQQLISKIESGQVNVSVAILEKIRHCLGTSDPIEWEAPASGSGMIGEPGSSYIS